MQYVLGLFLIVLSQFSWASNVQLSFRAPIIDVTANSTLSEMLRIKVSDRKIENKLGSMLIFDAFSSHSEITQQKVSSFITASYPDVGDSIEWRGVQEIKIRLVTNVSASYLTQIARDFLRQKLAASFPYAQLQIQPMSRLNTKVKGQVKNIDIRQDSKTCKIQERTCVDFTIFNQAGHKQTIRQWYRVDLLGKALVARREYPQGHFISREDYEIQEALYFESCPAGNIYRGNSDVRYRLTSAMKKGQMLCKHHLEIAPLVNANTKVLVELHDGPIFISAKGVALNDGEMKEAIQVRIEQANTPVAAVVIGQGRVRVYGS